MKLKCVAFCDVLRTRESSWFARFTVMHISVNRQLPCMPSYPDSNSKLRLKCLLLVRCSLTANGTSIVYFIKVIPINIVGPSHVWIRVGQNWVGVVLAWLRDMDADTMTSSDDETQFMTETSIWKKLHWKLKERNKISCYFAKQVSWRCVIS